MSAGRRFDVIVIGAGHAGCEAAYAAARLGAAVGMCTLSPDTVAHIAGIPINPLPLLMAATMFLQMKMAPQGGDPMQRKIFMFMPLIFVYLCYNFASALALYWTVQNIISIEQLVVNRSNQPVLAHPAPAK